MKTVDGKPSQIFRANCSMRGVFVEAGTHTIVMNYRPTSVLMGGIISSVSCLVLVVTSLFYKRKTDLGN